MENRSLSVQARAMQRAADILGGKDRLRAALRVPLHRLEDWLQGKSLPPTDVFLKTVDILSAPAAITPPATAARARVPSRQPRAARFLDSAFARHERDAMLSSALDAALEAGQATMGNVQVRTGEGLRIVAHRGFDGAFLEFFACVTEPHCACGAALKAGARIVISDVASDPIFAGTDAVRVLHDAGARAVQSTPLVAASGEVLGMLSTHYPEPRTLAGADLDAIDHIARRAAFWLEQPTA